VAITRTTDVDTAIPELWADRVLRDHAYSGFWSKFLGTAIVQQFELLNRPGDLVHIQVTNPLSGSGVSGDETVLEGNEENLTTTEIKLQPEQQRHAIRNFRRAAKKSIVDLRMEARMRLAEWGMVQMDTNRFTNFAAASLTVPAGETYTPNIFSVGGTHTSVDNIANTEELDVEAVQQIKVRLQANRARPLLIDGDELYALVVHPYALYQLKRQDEYRAWVREAHVRGADNPFFKGATAVLDGVVIYEHFRSPLVTNSAPVQVNKGIAFGAEAFVEALDENPSWDEDVFDYGNQYGMAYSFAHQARRALELSSLQVYSYAPTVGA
jgi:N4-gp56 family major capsid protein